MKKRIISALMVSSIALGSVAVPLVAVADEYDNKIEQSNKKIEDLKAKEASASAQLAEVKANIENIRVAAEKLQTEQVTLDKQVTSLGKEIELLHTRIEKRNETIKDQARSAQVNGQSNGYLDAILSSESISDAITRVAAASKLVSASNDLLKQQEMDKQSVETKKAETETKLDKINKNAAELESKKGELIEQELQQQALVNEVAAEKTNEEGKKAEFLKKKEAAEKELAAHTKQVEEANKAAATNAAPATPDNGNGNSNGPVANTPDAPQGTPQNTPVAPAPSQPVAPAPPVNSGSAGAILAEAAKHIGKPYVWGAKGPDTFDCSGFTRYVFLQVTGRDIGGYTVPQESAGVQIDLSQVQAGDLLFWGGRGGTSHVAISTGGSGYIHAPAPGQTVTYGSFSGFMPSFAVRVL